MPYSDLAPVHFVVSNTLIDHDPVHWQVANDDRPADDVTFTISRQLVESWEQPSLYFRARIKLGGEWIPESEFLGELEIEDPPADSHTGQWSFILYGRRWSMARTSKVFARTPVEIYLDHGPAGGVLEPVTPDYSGYVLGCDQTSRHAPVVKVTCGDQAALYERYLMCEEYEPNTGETRLQITQEVCAAAGILVVEGPDGGVYNKPLQWTNKPLFQTLKVFWEPAGGRLRFRPDGTLEIWRPRLKTAPEPPDHVWRKGDDSTSVRYKPPENCPSRWVVHATAVVVVDEIGFTHERTRVEIEDLYAPKVALFAQDTAGDADPTGLEPQNPGLRIVSVIETTAVKRGNQVIDQRVQEWAWKNLRAARLVTAPGGSGTAGGGYNYVSAKIDEEGKFVQWEQEKFLQVLDRRLHNSFTDETINATVIDTWRWGLKVAGVKTVGAMDDTTVIGTYVHDDDQSYSSQVEQWDLFERQAALYTYAPNGPAQVTQLDDYRWEAPRCRVDGPTNTGYFIRYDGKGQTEVISQWRLAEQRKVVDVTTSDNLISGQSEHRFAWTAARREGGAFDWGDFESDAEEQTFQRVGRKSTDYSAEIEGQVESVEYPEEGGRIPRRFLGSLPIARYRGSVWTALQMQPLEVVVDDSTALLWFGYERATLMLEHVQTEEEALTVINDRRRRALAPKAEVTRPDHACKVGDTVRWIAEEDGFDGRFIVTRKKRNWGVLPPMATYLLEEWRQ